MGSNYQRGGALSPDTAGIQMGLTDEERALWEFMGPFEANKEAMLLDPGSRRWYNNINRDVDPMLTAEPGPHWLLDRCGDREFSPAAVFVNPTTYYRRPLIVKHPTTGRLRFLFGIGNTTGFAMSSALAGCLKNMPVLKGGVETNAKALILPGVGFTLFGKIATGVPGSTETIIIVKLVDDEIVEEAVSITWPAIPGGVVFGGASTVAITDCMRFDLQNSTGKIRVLLQSGAGSNDMVERNFDHRTAIAYKVRSTFSVSPHTQRLWIDGVAETPKTLGTIDVGNSAGSNRPMFGGLGDIIAAPPAAAGPTNGFVGYVDALGFSQGDWGKTDEAGEAIDNFLDTRGGP